MVSKFDLPLGRQLVLESACGTCIGCTHRRGHGDQAWCANTSIAVQSRPQGKDMRGCGRFVARDARSASASPVGVSLARIAARRSSR